MAMIQSQRHYAATDRDVRQHDQHDKNHPAAVADYQVERPPRTDRVEAVETRALALTQSQRPHEWGICNWKGNR